VRMMPNGFGTTSEPSKRTGISFSGMFSTQRKQLSGWPSILGWKRAWTTRRMNCRRMSAPAASTFGAPSRFRASSPSGRETLYGPARRTTGVWSRMKPFARCISYESWISWPRLITPMRRKRLAVKRPAAA